MTWCFVKCYQKCPQQVERKYYENITELVTQIDGPRKYETNTKVYRKQIPTVDDTEEIITVWLRRRTEWATVKTLD